MVSVDANGNSYVMIPIPFEFIPEPSERILELFEEMADRGTVLLPSEPMTIEVTMNHIGRRIAEILGLCGQLPDAGSGRDRQFRETEDLILATQTACRPYVWHSVTCVCDYCLKQDLEYIDLGIIPDAGRLFERKS